MATMRKINDRFGEFEGHISYFSPNGCSLGKPDCPYMKGFICDVYNAKDKGSVCCYYSNSDFDEMSFDDSVNVVDMFRCCWLPSWVKNGFREVKFYDGVLHGEVF